MKVPSDLDILEAIYKDYYQAFASYEKSDDSRTSKVYVPIDCAKIAKLLKTDGDIVFGRLYYHLQNKYGYKKNNGLNIDFFALSVGQTNKPDRHVVNFPLMASVLAGMQQENAKFEVGTKISIVALAISLCSIVVTLLPS